MGTFANTIVETKSRADFWEVARKLGVTPDADASVPPVVLIECDLGLDFEASIHLAEALARDLETACLGFYAQTGADAYEIRAFDRGACLRRLAYSRDQGGWLHVEGARQAWERAFFFDDAASTAPGAARWPAELHDELSDEEIARYEAAKAQGDPSRAMDLLRAGRGSLERTCGFFGLDLRHPTARWKKPSVWSRLFVRSAT